MHEEALPDGWTEHRAPDGTLYYFNSVLSETQWSRPGASAGVGGWWDETGVIRPPPPLPTDAPSDPETAEDSDPPPPPPTQPSEEPLFETVAVVDAECEDHDFDDEELIQDFLEKVGGLTRVLVRKIRDRNVAKLARELEATQAYALDLEAQNCELRDSAANELAARLETERENRDLRSALLQARERERQACQTMAVVASMSSQYHRSKDPALFSEALDDDLVDPANKRFWATENP
mmetsp:Transcript_17598/g.41495  ORF Transcript_17598/g.41495 Transcript_17598/m.41495 type:complete len:236 (+) Transcript_17598:14-721(+)